MSARPTPVGSGDRLGVTLLFSLIAHGVLALGLTFEYQRTAPSLPALDVILVQSASGQKPEKADFLAQAHELYPRAKRVLLVDRDYSSTSPAVQAIALGRADYHLVRPWADDEMMYRAMSEFLSSWMKEQEPNFELFRIVAEEGDSRMLQLRDVLTRFNLPFGFYPLQGEAGRQLLDVQRKLDQALRELQDLKRAIRPTGDKQPASSSHNSN